MPVSKRKRILAAKKAERDALEVLHGRISRQEFGAGRAFAPGEDGHEAGRLLRILEERGRVLNVPGVGWVDAEPAVKRYKEYIGETRPTENLRKAHEAAQHSPDCNDAEDHGLKIPKRNPQHGGGDPDWDNYGSPGRPEDDYVNYPTKETGSRKVAYDHHNEPYYPEEPKRKKKPKKREIDYEEGNRG